VWRSAVGALSFHHSLGATPNPSDSPAVAAVVEGIRRAWRTREEERLAKRPVAFALTPEVLRELRPWLPDAEPLASLVWAAVNLGVFAVCRPSEFLGKIQDRDGTALPAAAVVFRAAAGAARHSGTAAVGRIAQIVEVNLGRTKTDQHARKPPKVIAAPQAVEALTRWAQVRAAFAPSSLFFADEGGKPLAQAHLLRLIRVAMGAIGRGSETISGKSFRRGGASALVAQGLSNADAAEVGGWATSDMLDTYASAEAKRARLEKNSRRMARRSAPAAAAASSSSSSAAAAGVGSGKMKASASRP
jgi:hypothetical protein